MFDNIYKMVDDYIDREALLMDEPDDENVIFTNAYLKFLKNGKVGIMTEREARNQKGYDPESLGKAVDAMKRARAEFLKLGKGSDMAKKAVNMYLPYEALFRIAY